MRIVVSGTHASGKSTLISDFALAHPDFHVLPDPFELVDEAGDTPGAGMFAAQLRASASRLLDGDLAVNLIAERGPLDFLAYLIALDGLGAAAVSPELLERATSITTEALEHVDLLVVLPLSAADPIEVPSDEEPELRLAMNDVLLELADDTDVIGTRTTVVELTGAHEARASALDAEIDRIARRDGVA